MDKLKVKSKHLILGLFMVVFGFYSAMANNIQVSNVSLVGQNISQDYSLVKFDLSWDNSWFVSSPPYNHDAAWVFIKYRRKIENVWHHAKLHWVDGTGTNDGHTEPSNSFFRSWNDNSGTSNGIMIRRSSYSSQSSFSVSNIKLRWDYGANGLNDNDSVEIAVYAIEMVYVRPGPFYLGSGGSETGHFYKYPTSTDPYHVTSGNAISYGSVSGNLFSDGGSGTHTIQSNMPKGYTAFYCMKYEISQGQYADFLRSITYPAYRYSGSYSGSNRYDMQYNSGEYVSNSPFLPCNYLKYNDLLAYLDWAALRPMTEMEYEKACRGTAQPLANEYVWGTNFRSLTAYVIANWGLSNEKVSSNYATTKGNAAIINTVTGPLRCGIFADHANNTGRQTSGATYWGIMEMAGNLSELTVNVLTSSSFTGKHGDGVLGTYSSANEIGWPTSSTHIIYRGGSWSQTGSYCLTSSRNGGTSNQREPNFGGRGVRSL